MYTLDYIANNAWMLFFVCTILGLTVGSFLNVVIYRLPLIINQQWQTQAREILADECVDTNNESPDEKPFNLIYPNSCCPHCKTPIKPWQNIPVLSYLMLGGKCAQCQHPISKRYPLIEIITAILTFIVVWQLGLNMHAVVILCFTWALLTLTMVDFDHQLLPDSITLPLLWAGLIINSNGLIVTLSDALWGAIAGYMILWSVYWLFKLVTGKEGMGYGDFKLLGALGAWLGWQAIPMIILLSSIVGLIIGLTLIVLHKQKQDMPMPFGPYLAGAGWITALWAEPIISTYYQFLG